MSLIWQFEHITKTGCMALHHATVIPERWVCGEGEGGGVRGRGRLSLSLEQLHLACKKETWPSSAPVTTHPQGRCPSNTTRLNIDLSHITNISLGLINEVYETVAGIDPAGSSGRSFRSRI
jgi:hypothetical protein